ncbi:ABC transporter ATP-binding protein [Streptomyces sp. DH37]|uniref:ABC transporter ATP-binding protein n=1 Tax=Streptomyces sp. DH37 TaxID=3040122 RepID=UPI00244135BE|nr:ABC transporter ATP-binding protein [Streptomyces sp. DH37]MDG9700865.1 ABC transporter ATP-binding protein [Streptomyces sp. DH37]
MTTAPRDPAPASAGTGDSRDADPPGRPPRRLLSRAARSAPGSLSVLLAARATGAVTALLVPTALAAATDTVLTGRPATGPVLVLGALLALGTLAHSAAEAAAGAGSATVTGWLRRTLLRHLIASGPAASGRLSPGDLTGRLVGGAQEAALAVTAVPEAVVACCVSVGGLAVLFGLDPWSAATLLLAVVPALALMRTLTVRSADLFLRYQRIQGDIAALLVGALAGARTIRACGTADREVRRVLAPLPSLAEAGRGAWGVQRTVVTRMLLVVPVVQTAVIAVAGHGVSTGRISPGDLLAVIACTTLALRFLEQTDGLVGFARGRAGLRRVAEVLGDGARAPGTGPGAGTDAGTEADVDTGAGAGDHPRAGAVSLRAVTVRRGAATLLDSVDLDLPAGSLTAVVGRSGSGKSTLAAVVGGLARPDRGRVLLDGVPLSLLPPAALRRRVAYAFERPALLGSTLHEVIAYGRPGAPRAAVVRAARLACADTFVSRLPLGYATPTDRALLSGGEVQRLGLARALLQDASVLVLDDATSSLDTITSMRVGRVLTDHLRDRTRLHITHRASSAASADRVLWLDRGRVRACGHHTELWQDPRYRALFSGPDVPGGAPGGPAPGRAADPAPARRPEDRP